MMNFTNNPYLNNGMIPAQRLMQMENQFQPQYGQPIQQPQVMNQPIINASFVSNLQEAQAQPVGINTTNIAIDNTNNKIYLKRMDNNGISATKTYAPQEDAPSSVNATNAPEGINSFKEDLVGLKSEVSDLRNSFEKSFINLSVDLENIITTAVEAQVKKLKGATNGGK